MAPESSEHHHSLPLGGEPEGDLRSLLLPRRSHLPPNTDIVIPADYLDMLSSHFQIKQKRAANDQAPMAPEKVLRELYAAISDKQLLQYTLEAVGIAQCDLQ